MKYELDNGRTINIPDKDLENVQKKLHISYNEAVYTWLVDEEYITDPTVEELSEKAKKNRVTATVHQAKSTNSQKKERKPREKKENPLKKQIISHIFDSFFYDNASKDYPNLEIVIRNDEKYIDLCVDGVEFTINLVEHRPKK